MTFVIKQQIKQTEKAYRILLKASEFYGIILYSM